MRNKSVYIVTILVLIILLPSVSNAQHLLRIHDSSDGFRLERTIEEFVRMGGLIDHEPMDQYADIMLMTTQQVIDAAAAGEIVPINAKEDASSLFAVGENVYGCIISTYKTWFRVESLELWRELGIQPPEGIITWESFVNLAESVRKYNQSHSMPINLIDAKYGRFEQSVLLSEYPEVYAQWQEMKDIVGNENALLKECVLTLNAVGNAEYITGFEYEDRKFSLSKPEMRCYTIPANSSQIENAQQFIELYEKNKEIGILQSGIIADELTYQELLGGNEYFSVALSEKNFEHWKALR